MNNNFALENAKNKPKKNERGAALISALLFTALLLGVCGALIVSTSMTAANEFDSTSEMQAYYAAEAGLQATMDVLRGNVAPVDGSTSKINFKTAITPGTSNKTGDASTTAGIARLSKWLPYNSSGAYTDRVTLTTVYTATSGSAYSVIIKSGDNVTGSTEPKKVLVQVIGYGPKNAIKKMEMVVGKGFLNSFTSPATITLIGGATGASIAVGSSNSSSYSGIDVINPTITPNPAIGVTTTTDLTIAKAATTGNPDVYPLPSLLSSSVVPYYVQTADAARNFLNDIQQVAETTDRYYTPLNLPTSLGTSANPQLTFVDGDLTLSNSSGTGHGLLIVTGTMTFNGDCNFNGLILVLGGGRVYRSGGGGGTIAGSVLVARFDRYTYGAPFLAPTFDTSGGGNSSLLYNSAYANQAVNNTVRRTIGVVEN